MDILALLRELSNSGISDIVLLVVIPLLVRYWISEAKSELRQEMRSEVSGAIDEKLKEFREYIDARFDAQDARFDAQDAKFKDFREHMDARFDAQDARFDKQDARIDQLDRKNDSRAYDMTLHLIDVRERLANIEGRLGMYPPRRGVDPPIPEPAAEPESNEPAQS